MRLKGLVRSACNCPDGQPPEYVSCRPFVTRLAFVPPVDREIAGVAAAPAGQGEAEAIACAPKFHPLANFVERFRNALEREGWLRVESRLEGLFASVPCVLP
jgi:hypothetical protein